MNTNLKRNKKSNYFTNRIIFFLLKLLALNFNRRKSVKSYLESEDGWVNFTLGMQLEGNFVSTNIIFKDGKVTVTKGSIEGCNSWLIFYDTASVREMIFNPPSQLFHLLLKNRVTPGGNLAYLQLFNFLISVLMKKKHIKMLQKENRENLKNKNQKKTECKPGFNKKIEFLKCEEKEEGVKYLKDPYLSNYSIDDFPRLQNFLEIHFTEKPSICHERPLLLTQWYRENGFEKDKSGKNWIPEKRQALAFKHLMGNRKPIIRKDDIIAGTTTTKEIGVVLYPDTHGTMIWGELFTAPHRALNPYDISSETINVLHKNVFPFWIKRNMRERVREKENNPLYQQLDERFAVYFLWKTVALSHTIIDYPKVLSKGTKGIIDEINGEIKNTNKNENDKLDLLEAMIITLEGINVYALNLSKAAKIEAETEKNENRKVELNKLVKICSTIPMNPASTLDEAVNSIWIIWVAIHMENTNAGFSIGRLDQWLQPYFESDISRLKTDNEREEYISHAVELIGSFYMKCTDHLPLTPDIGNYLFGGSSSDQAITLGGVMPDGEDAVNDMTYIFLKVTEILKVRDPNVNARYHKEKNSIAYLKRLCEVNLNTTATPSIHNDEAVMNSLKEFNYPAEHLRDWSATGCVEPTLSGRHMGHTNCMMFNMVAALEMALNNGLHPLMRLHVGPKTGDISNNDFKSFEEFFQAFCKQFDFLAEQASTYNNVLGKAHQIIRPTPFLSSMIEGTISSGKDVTKGGAQYNSSGTACIGLADVTDSLMVIKKLIFDEKKFSFQEMHQAVKSDFKSNPELLAMAKNRVPLFGSGDKDALDMANRIVTHAHDSFGEIQNYRGGKYTVGFWSMSNHVAFGTLTGALPSGRLAGKAFTPGLTPEAHASKSILDNIRDVSMLRAENMNNNIAFNVKIAPGAEDIHEKQVENIYSYAKTYADMDGMQIQFNVVSSETLKDAMDNPDQYRDLLVRISGYNAYFTTLNRDMQIELIERAEFNI